MVYYKGYTIYWIAGDRWRVQTGYTVLGDYKTLGAAKAMVTKEVNNEINR